MKIAIASGKGGTGKTTLSTNLASYLSQTEKVVLTDLDVEEPNSGLFIKGNLIKKEAKYKMIPHWDKSKCVLCGRCHEVCNFNALIKLSDQIMIFPELCHSCYACSELCPVEALPMQKEKMGELQHWQAGRFEFVESKLDIGQEQAVPLISQTLEYVEENFDEDTIFLFDSPPGTSCPVIEVTKEADFVILITEPTPFGFHDLKLAVETMEELHRKYAVVINRDGIGNSEVEDYCREKQIKILAKLPNDRQIATLYSHGELVYEKIEKFRDQLKGIADFITSLQQGGR